MSRDPADAPDHSLERAADALVRIADSLNTIAVVMLCGADNDLTHAEKQELLKPERIRLREGQKERGW